MKIINTLVSKIKNLDESIKKLMCKGYSFSFLLCIFASLTLFTYEIFYSNPTLYYIGLSLFRTSLMFACTFFICGIGFDTIKKERI